ncbi:MAG: helix-turn-helix domain-containing protein [Actinomycetota bacterium]|nr:helix-turn-helix domain-containing protein [Actinomycetota bacterium]
MPDAEHPTRVALLDVSLALADERPLAALPVDEIARAAGVAKGTFYVHFADRGEFLGALHDWFRARLAERVAEAVDGVPAGSPRLRVGCEAYLDACRDAAGVKAMFSSARGEAVVDERIAASDAAWARACAVDLEHMGDRRAPDTARLLVAALAEVVRVEVRDGPQPALREAFRALFGLDG